MIGNTMGIKGWMLPVLLVYSSLISQARAGDGNVRN